eukprot:SAG25_NODE_5236_length_684_cov_1.063248_1_plen_52_part_10
MGGLGPPLRLALALLAGAAARAARSLVRHHSKQPRPDAWVDLPGRFHPQFRD